MSVTTKKGDGGFTRRGSGPGVPKDDPFIECLGTLDELDAFLAFCENSARKNQYILQSGDIVAEVRRDLFDTVMPAVSRGFAGPVSMPDLVQLERHIADLEKNHPVRNFIRTWTGAAAVNFNLARTICRRAERRMVSIAGEETAHGSAPFLAWMNRLSDLLFLLAIAEQE
jgi:cob(I)alamin adenosyltransferase